MNILVLAGGLSPERDVSLSSASRIAKALIAKGNKVAVLDLYYGIHDVKEFFFTDDSDEIEDYTVSEKVPDIMQSSDIEAYIGKNVLQCCKMADIVFLALHGDIGENGKLQAVLDLYKIKYTGSGYNGCLLSMDKNIAKILVSAGNIKTAKWCLNEMEHSIDFPCVVKPLGVGSSIGISMVENSNEYETAICEAKKYDSDILIEEKICGREFSVGILNNKALPVIEIIPKNNEFYNYKNKYQMNLTDEICPADIPKHLAAELKQKAEKIHQMLNLKFYSRIDFIVDCKNNVYFLEANSLPGMTPSSLLPQEAAAMGISYEDLCNQIAESALM
ncbi:MAG: D-alanine--D-alanine ligase [Eubacterium sp.]|nr:D-alanine--D-alanine ligase [Eubacterium sp.]